MKKGTFALIFYCIPWAFLALYGDAVYFWGWQYLLILVCSAAAALFRHEQGRLLLLGNILSFGISLLLICLVGFSEMNDYFKPFGAVGWTSLLSLFYGLVQWLVWKRQWLVLGLLTVVLGLFLGSAYWLQFTM